jgi:hypothetical protein
MMDDPSGRALSQHGSPLLSELADVLEADEGFVSSTCVLEQYAYACRILQDERQDSVPYSAIGSLFNVDKGTLRKQMKEFPDRLQLSAIMGRPPLRNEARDSSVSI